MQCLLNELSVAINDVLAAINHKGLGHTVQLPFVHATYTYSIRILQLYMAPWGVSARLG